jgi:mannose-6-phosphate isomerase-like protein (cupin superfamily)
MQAEGLTLRIAEACAFAPMPDRPADESSAETFLLAHLVHLDDVPLENQDKSKGWTISRFCLPITGKDGSPSTLFHGLFQPGSEHSMHLHNLSDELCIYISGEGLVGAGDDRLRIGPGCARLMPRTVPHFFHNASVAEPAEVFGIYVGAGDVAATGYAYCGKPTAEDLARAEEPPGRPLHYPVVRIADVAPDRADDIGWRATDFRPLLATSEAPFAFCFSAEIAPGGSRAVHSVANADAYYLVHAGSGTAGSGAETAKLRPGHVWWVPAGRSSWLRNDSANPLKLYGYYVGAPAPSSLAYRFEKEAPEP